MRTHLDYGGNCKQEAMTSVGTQGMNPRNSGIALVAVLVALVAVMMLAVGSLMLSQSSLMMAENQTTSSIARSNADAGLDSTIAVLFEAYKAGGSLPSFAPALPTVTGVRGIDFAAPSDGWYTRVSDHRAAIRIVGTGPRGAEYMAEALVDFAGEVASGGSPFNGSILACESLRLSGSGRIDSFDSRTGPYTAGSAGARGDVIALSDRGVVELTGNAPIYGSIAARGSVTFTGSSTVYGTIHANGNVNLSAHTTYPGSLLSQGNVNFNIDATVQGDVLANGNVTFNNWNARANSNVQAGGTITKKAADMAHHVPNGAIRPNDNPYVEAVPDEECDPLDVTRVMAGFSSLPAATASIAPDWWPYTQWRLSPTGATRRNASNKVWEDVVGLSSSQAEVFGKPSQVIHATSLNFGAGEELRVSGGNVVLVIDGDFNAAANFNLAIESGSSLTVFVKGKTNLGASFKVTDGTSNANNYPPPVTASGQPSFSIFSSYSGNDGVVLNGNGKLTAVTYAPLTDVKLGGSGELFGAVRGRNVSNPGGTAIHFDEALANVDLGGGSAGTTVESSITVVSRR